MSRLALGLLGWLVASLLPNASGVMAAESPPRSILVISEAHPGGTFYPAIFSSLRAAVNEETVRRVSVFSEVLGFSQFNDAQYRTALKAFLSAKYSSKTIGVIVALGPAALEYVLSERDELWPGIPVVFTFVDPASLKKLKLPPDVTGHTSSVTFNDMLNSARVLVPGLERVVLLGDRLDGQVYYSYLKDEVANSTDRDIEIVDLTGLPLLDVKTRVASLPGRTAIIYTAMYSDGAGNVYAPMDALARIAEVANRPIVVGLESYIGRGGAGGVIITTSNLGAGAAQLALRVLDGEAPSAMPIADGGAARYVFDWRQLQRWGVSESRLPPGAEIRFRVPAVWEQYGWQLMVVAAAMLLQAILIAGLLHEHRRRGLAEDEALRRVNELAHANRVATAGELSAAIAHEIKQPLTAIISNGSAGLRWLDRQGPDIAQAQAVLKRIVGEGNRANRIIDDIRAMFRKENGVREFVDINELLRETISLVDAQMQKYDVSLQITLPEDPKPVVLADRTQLQQVVLNLIMNAIEAMSAVTMRPRLLQIFSTSDKNRAVLITIQDSGTGIEADNIEKIFDSFFTTKASGMGLGLSICRSIIQAHGGRLWATANVPNGAIFNIWLPANK